MTESLVSVIIPVHNRSGMLREAVASVQEQGYPSLEIIIVDDGSSDDTPRVMSELQDCDPRIVTRSRPQAGPGAARETGRLIAAGEFIQYLDSDDLLLQGKLSRQVERLIQNPRAGLCMSRTRYRDATGEVVSCTWKQPIVPGAPLFPAILDGRGWETATPLYRRSSLDRIGPWSTLWLEEDWEYDSRVGALGGEVELVDAELVEHRDHSGPLLSVGDPFDPWRLHQRSVAHQKVCEHALSAGMHRSSPEMRKFARTLFFLGRRCGAAGLGPDAGRLVNLSLWIDPEQSDALFYKSVAERAGWKRIGKLAHRMDRLR